jgi:hypothetical protein
MLRSTLIFAVIAIGSMTPASAQDFTAEQRAACKGDYETFCKGTIAGGGRVLACLSKQGDKLSAACTKIVNAQKK